MYNIEETYLGIGDTLIIIVNGTKKSHARNLQKY
jgi:hypothetical protein